MRLSKRIINILLFPAKEWRLIKEEPDTPVQIFRQYVVIMAAIPSLALFCKAGLSQQHPVVSLFIVTTTYILNLAGTYALALIIDTLSPSFSASKNMHQSFKISAYAITPYWLCGGAFNLIPFLSKTGILIGGCYFLYLLLLGVREIKDVPQEKQILFSMTVAMLAFVAYLAVHLLLINPLMVMATIAIM